METEHLMALLFSLRGDPRVLHFTHMKNFLRMLNAEETVYHFIF